MSLLSSKMEFNEFIIGLKNVILEFLQKKNIKKIQI